MLWYFIGAAIVNLLNTFEGIVASAFNFTQNPELPFGLDAYLTTGVGYAKYIMYIFPPFETVFHAALWYLSFRLVLVALRIFRILPSNHNA